jgi:hypothetical protein
MGRLGNGRQFAQFSGDLIAAEGYLQHAEHYNRLIAAAQELVASVGLQRRPSATAWVCGRRCAESAQPQRERPHHRFRIGRVFPKSVRELIELGHPPLEGRSALG